ncbi:hypothetical protein NQ318_003373 [Aromia moschata]|uniref:Uncharacterized protein n=1 Tax=Aromia moschata TaxID=1265417 RepID=A0AAV8Y9A1_9CUCU|nr:hypothetical protein NQ318_003373 [Aromia moschata]
MEVFIVEQLDTAESAFVIMCCEKASAAGRKTKELCYKIQDDFDTESKQRKELFKLAEVLETYKPKFTAANFFVIDQDYYIDATTAKQDRNYEQSNFRRVEAESDSGLLFNSDSRTIIAKR